MADLQINAKARINKDGLKQSWDPGILQIAMSAARVDAGVIAVGTTEEDFVFGTDISTKGFLFLKNLDGTNKVEYGPKNASDVMQDFGEMKAGEIGIVRLKAGVTVRAIALVASCDVAFLLTHD